MSRWLERVATLCLGGVLFSCALMFGRIMFTALSVWHLYPSVSAKSFIHFVLETDPFWGVIWGFVIACVVFPTFWFYEARRKL